MKEEYGFDYEIIRGKDQDSYSTWTKYKFAHDGIKVFVLPPYKAINAESIEAVKPVKIYYTHKTTFQDLKNKVAKYLTTTTGVEYTPEHLRFWKPSFYHATKIQFTQYLKRQSIITEERTSFQERMEGLCNGTIRE